MLTFYYHPLSPIARRVWLALLEKGIPFEARFVDLTGEQLQPEFLALNPFHHVPVIVDQGVRVLESLAILDYLEAQYPSPSLLPSSPGAIAQTRMVQFVTANELMTKIPALLSESPEAATAQAIAQTLDFLQTQLGDAPFFGGATLSLADITLGAALPLLRRLGLSVEGHGAIADWGDRLQTRAAWQQTEPNEADFLRWKRWISARIKRHQRQKAS